MRVLGFMTGTSLDAVDMAILETDGETIHAFGPAGERKLSEATRDVCIRATSEALAWPRGAPVPMIFETAARTVAEEHFRAAEAFLKDHGIAWRDLDLMGMHGQTVLHERPRAGRAGRTVQLGDAQWLARATGVRVAHDFRTADVAAGGEGAPLAPIYHLARARTSGLEPPLAVLNLGGVGNITIWSSSDDSDDLVAFDTGPGNGMIDQVVQARGLGRFDDGGHYARAGKVDADALATYLKHPYFEAAPPKSLDRYDFPIAPLDALSVEDAAATLVAFTTEAVRLALGRSDPRELIVTGGGRHNPEIMKALRERLLVPVRTAEDLGWRGDAIEAEAFAFLAARTARGLPISFPRTTGAKTPLPGGTIVIP